jgi:hypothetical protein
MKRIAIYILTVLLGGQKVSGQNFFNRPVFISPGLTVGYTINAKMNFGFTLDVGIIDKNKVAENKYGFSFYQYYIYTGKHMHRLRSVSVMYQNSYVDVKFGRGRAKNPWGYSNRNRCIVHGFALDVSFTYPSVYSPWLGYRLFSFNKADWAWFMTNYNTIYLKYKFDVIQNTELNKTVTLEK